MSVGNSGKPSSMDEDTVSKGESNTVAYIDDVNAGCVMLSVHKPILIYMSSFYISFKCYSFPY